LRGRRHRAPAKAGALRVSRPFWQGFAGKGERSPCFGMHMALILTGPSELLRRHILAEVRIFEGESIESALRRFKRQVQQEGIVKDFKKHSYYLKPGEKKRIKSALAQKLKRKKVRRQPPETDAKVRSTTQYG